MVPVKNILSVPGIHPKTGDTRPVFEIKSEALFDWFKNQQNNIAIKLVVCT